MSEHCSLISHLIWNEILNYLLDMRFNVALAADFLTTMCLLGIWLPFGWARQALLALLFGLGVAPTSV